MLRKTLGEQLKTGGSFSQSVSGKTISRIVLDVAFILEKAVGTAEYAKHAKAEQIGEEDRFTQRVNCLVSLTPFPLAYWAYFAV